MDSSATHQVTINIPIAVDANDLWAAVLGSGWDTFSWWTASEYLTGDWDHAGIVRITAEDPDSTDDTFITREIDLDALVRATQNVAGGGYVDGCTGHAINWSDLDFDACVGDLILQVAVFGEPIYS